MILITTFTSNTGRIIVEGKRKLGNNEYIIVEGFDGISNMGFCYNKTKSLIISKMNNEGLINKIDYKFI